VNRPVAALVATLLVAGCSSGAEPADEPAPGAQAGGETTRAPREPAPRRPRLRRAHCPSRLTNCRAASGRIIYVERVDPDGDGDAHFVLLSPQGITAPGITVVDVERSLRPSPLPGPGQRLSAAGPVHRGSYGQRQIEAIEVHSGG
jgi:hypothetical protein